MRRLLHAHLLLALMGLAGLVHYEVVAKSHRLPGGPLPGWETARRADRAAPFVRWTGQRAVDRLLHESSEAVIFYRLLLGASTAGAPLAALHVRQHP